MNIIAYCGTTNTKISLNKYLNNIVKMNEYTDEEKNCKVLFTKQPLTIQPPGSSFIKQIQLFINSEPFILKYTYLNFVFCRIYKSFP